MVGIILLYDIYKQTIPSMVGSKPTLERSVYVYIKFIFHTDKDLAS